MATFTTREVVTRRKEWIVPAGQPWGATWEEVDKAVAAAWAAYRERHGWLEDAPMPGDFARFYPRDEDIVIVVTFEDDVRPPTS
ncbi:MULTISPECIES: hypothetical protein [Streptomyces]|uniref:hypothetical protein n=1 Tax=Streptomyces TaxID=1883 RepID=UPI0004CD2A92|nr:MULTISPECIES: hypothetical protein [Streptomyces]KOT57074.1 hypothetical protein ADK43_21830 [Streptomyces rimosus subsp. rimosus]